MPALSFVLLKSPAQVDPAAVVSTFTQLFPDELPLMHAPSSKADVVEFRSGDAVTFVALMDAPVPGGEADEATVRSLSSFRKGGFTLPPHLGHLLVTSLGDQTKTADGLARHTQLVAAITKASNAVGVYEGSAGATHDPKFYVSVATETTYPTMLWNGNPFNMENISWLADALRHLQTKADFTLRFICEDPPPQDFCRGLRVEWKRFDHETERDLIAGSWFGIAPLPESRHNRCKGAYKVKTYCASGLPVVASPVGFQGDLVRAGQGIGFLPESWNEWEQSMLRLLQDRDLVRSMGTRAREYAEGRFSYQAVAPAWAAALRRHFAPPSLS